MKTLPLLPTPKHPISGARSSRIEVSEENYDIICENYPEHCEKINAFGDYYLVSPEVFDLFRKAGYDFEALPSTSFKTFNGEDIGAKEINEYYKNLKDEK